MEPENEADPLFTDEGLELSHLRDAVREHRAAQTPAMWTDADRKLYEDALPEVTASSEDAR